MLKSNLKRPAILVLSASALALTACGGTDAEIADYDRNSVQTVEDRQVVTPINDVAGEVDYDDSYDADLDDDDDLDLDDDDYDDDDLDLDDDDYDDDDLDLDDDDDDIDMDDDDDVDVDYTYRDVGDYSPDRK